MGDNTKNTTKQVTDGVELSHRKPKLDAAIEDADDKYLQHRKKAEDAIQQGLNLLSIK